MKKRHDNKSLIGKKVQTIHNRRAIAATKGWKL